jgi:hypothetical protein
MRRNYISPEYQHKRVYGSYNMVEESNFFGSKMLDIEDLITIEKQDLVYYQNVKGEQIDFSTESLIKSINYSTIKDKEVLHTLVLDETQPKTQKDKNAKWILTIEIKSLLENFLFATMKKYRTFEGLKNEMTLEGDVNTALRKYIDYNVINRYKIKTINLYIQYKDIRNLGALKLVNNWDPKSMIEPNKMSKTQRETSVDGSQIKLIFNQEKSSEDFNFTYFFVPIFEKM